MKYWHKRQPIPLFVGKRETKSLFRANAERQSLFVGKKEVMPMFVGKKSNQPSAWGKQLSQPMFIRNRNVPMFVGKRGRIPTSETKSVPDQSLFDMADFDSSIEEIDNSLNTILHRRDTSDVQNQLTNGLPHKKLDQPIVKVSSKEKHMNDNFKQGIVSNNSSQSMLPNRYGLSTHGNSRQVIDFLKPNKRERNIVKRSTGKHNNKMPVIKKSNKLNRYSENFIGQRHLHDDTPSEILSINKRNIPLTFGNLPHRQQQRNNPLSLILDRSSPHQSRFMLSEMALSDPYATDEQADFRKWNALPKDEFRLAAAGTKQEPVIETGQTKNDHFKKMESEDMPFGSKHQNTNKSFRSNGSDTLVVASRYWKPAGVAVNVRDFRNSAVSAPASQVR